ncbi:ABC transporter ATP-binding protein [Microbacterium sp. NPDC091313]
MTARTANGISLNALTKDYGTGIPAVAGVDLHIAPGEFMTFLGPSGSGKTTTLNMIAGFEDVTDGTVRIADTDVSSLPAHKRDLGMVFQSYALFPHMTVAQNVAFPLVERKVPKAEADERVREALALVHLSEYADRRPRELSGGQQQRVALARAVVFRPRALLLDEPLGALDRKLRASLQLEIRRLHRELGLTCVFVTHDQEEAMFLSDRIAVFNAGRIEQIGSPAELYDEPRTLFVAQFLGDSNVFQGRMTDGSFVWRDCRWAAAAGSPEEGWLVVRPEHLTISSGFDSAASGSNSVPAIVAANVFLGAHCRLELRFADGSPGSAIVPAHQRGTFTEGDTVIASWALEDQRIVV